MRMRMGLNRGTTQSHLVSRRRDRGGIPIPPTLSVDPPPSNPLGGIPRSPVGHVMYC